jgi:hypothetical protein
MKEQQCYELAYLRDTGPIKLAYGMYRKVRVMQRCFDEQDEELPEI